MLAGRYFRMALTELDIKLKNFPHALFTARSVAVGGTFLVAQRTSAVAADEASQSVVSIGGLHSVVVKRSRFPFELFYEVRAARDGPPVCGCGGGSCTRCRSPARSCVVCRGREHAGSSFDHCCGDVCFGPSAMRCGGYNR
jgi:hypothetical protein